MDQGFVQSKVDYSVFTRIKGGSMIIILVYVDDILIASNDVDAVNVFKQFLDSKFKLKNLGTLKRLKMGLLKHFIFLHGTRLQISLPKLLDRRSFITYFPR